MLDSYQCFDCSKVTLLVYEKDLQKAKEGACPSCGGKGQIISEERLKEGLEAGAIYSIGADGKPIKNKS